MAAKKANISVRIDAEVKEEAEKIIDALGLSVSAVINSLYKQIIFQRGIPFDLVVPESTLVSQETSKTEISEKTHKKYIIPQEISKEEFDAIMEEGLSEAKHGESLPCEDVFNELLEEI